MALRASAYGVIVTPTGDNDEAEHGRLIVVHNETPHRRVLRGVVEHVGGLVRDDIEAGCVVHYNGHEEVLDGEIVKHVVPHQNILCMED